MTVLVYWPARGKKGEKGDERLKDERKEWNGGNRWL